MSNVVSPATVRTQFDRTLKPVENNQERFIIDRRGDPKAVIMSIQDFIKTIAPEPAVLKAIRDDAKAKGNDKLTMREISAEIGAYRSEQRQKAVKKSARFSQGLL
jgi:PHD/YefM family antitoxin component YafN of YafNO toxin-antitoxin module